MDQGLQTAHLASAWQDAFSLCEVHHAEAGDLLAPVSFLSLTVDLPLVPYIYMFTCRACPLNFWSCCSAGSAPDREKVEAACSQIGGKLVAAGEERESASLGQSRFSFSFLSRNWSQGWAGEACSPSSSNGSS